ncbi:18743_t:CDS:2 [Dentiscutata erythropus]|uniref:18743_t:CDS:1 n=1 Tax=Dentiscutata erythropus TaxID=1348616 RepID=A0A9N9GEF3_9GLOM|nr:18743_t:CDS:2 [Dentiscutata erythropus]
MLEDIYVNLAGIQVEISNTTKLHRDADKINNWHRELETIKSDIYYTEDELSNLGSTRTERYCQSYANERSETKRIEHTFKKVGRLKLELQSKKSDKENYNRLQKEITSLNEETKKYEDNVKMFDAQILELTPNLRETEIEINEFRQKKTEAEMAAINDLTEAQKQSERFFRLDRENLQGSSNYKIRLDELQKVQETVLSDSARYTGELKQLEEAVRRGQNELNTEYKDINDRYADQFIVVKCLNPSPIKYSIFNLTGQYDMDDLRAVHDVWDERVKAKTTFWNTRSPFLKGKVGRGGFDSASTAG